VQHSSFTLQACPDPVQVLLWHVPVVEPVGMEHEYPLQQSAVLVQIDPCGWQAMGGWHCLLEPSPKQRSEQQSVLLVQLEVFALHTPASGVPASGVPASVGGGGNWQAEMPVSVARHWVPEQHSVELLHCVPTVLHVPTVQTSFPFGPGTHGAPPQHWSLNWHSFPAAMQQPASPV